MDATEFHGRLRAEKERLGVTWEQLAAKMGRSYSCLSRWAFNKQVPKSEELLTGIIATLEKMPGKEVV